ncbi:thiamine phosphate synthase [Pedobacter rhizosphaerae]|uniref:Thiamine-phosphate pyrophosphorylase n=1 Tax=Pedobacter rhizosphaerae TaxID=390241 RepID=A0A1H9VKM7_9SPHI|nr:thiamine phosphate synthase [Pedobacter rhizosphaerae]SES22326.1 thiamine-phosphate pyrophosphorylase [Pedobacter rhizosphaerae]
MKLIVISNPIAYKGEKQIVNQLFDEGLEIYHLRKEKVSRDDYSKYIEAINPKYHHKIALHQYHELAVNYGINRFHYPEYERTKQLFIKAENGIYSTSIHQLAKLKEVKAFSYTFFSPVFNSLSKTGYMGLVDEHFKLDKTNDDPVIVALGGISAQNIKQVADMGFDGAAVLGALWNDPSNALNTFKLLQKELETNEFQ